MYENIKMENMTWREFAKKKDDVIILPIGSTEQHGPHLPTCVDTVIANGFAYRIAEKINGVVAPALSFGSHQLVRSNCTLSPYFAEHKSIASTMNASFSK